MKYQINLLKQPNQSLSANLTNNNGDILAVDINLRTLSDDSICADIFLDGNPLRYGVLVHTGIPFLKNNKLGGNIYFEDLYGNDDPKYTEFNTRFILVYDSDFTVGKVG